ncbi:Right handed beta helix region [Rubritalea squalenifaciens DSM 18772]|uniref:Right handed beta helix region n=2 Tax=Rubritalea squalenifaciens TaxID=407226 RepID=A0A1M6IE10_9BACT|nr:Right handed beta helix region [Rubritalea squalenifaciens DSM 18772]
MRAEEASSTRTQKKGMPWIKIAILVTVLMIAGAVAVQYLKWQETAASEKRLAEQSAVQRKQNSRKAVEDAQNFLNQGDLAKAERSILLAEGLDTDGELSGDIFQLKAKYKILKAKADEELEALKKREAKADEIISEINNLLAGAEIEAILSQLKNKLSSLDQIEKEGVSDACRKRIGQINSQIDTSRREANIKRLQNLLAEVVSLQTEEEVAGALKAIQARAARDPIPEELQEKIANASKELQQRLQTIQVVKTFQVNLSKENWIDAEQSITAMESLGLGDAQIQQYRLRFQELRAHAEKRDRRVQMLMNEFKSMDTSRFNAAAFSKLDQILEIAPEHAEALALKKRLSTTLDQIRVPGDVADIDEAVKWVNSGGRILLGEGLFYAEIELEKSLKIEGQGVNKTFIESKCAHGPAIYIKQKEGKVNIKGLTVKGIGYIDDQHRHALILVASNAYFENCEFVKAPGHGVAVIAGKLEMKGCKVSQSGWDGVTIKGEDSQAALTDCLFDENAEHGVDFWDGASGTVFRSKIASSSGSGLVVTGGSRVTLAQCTVEKNRETGVYIADGSLVKMDKVLSQGNLLSGVAIQGDLTSVEMSIVASAGNDQAGYFIQGNPTIHGLNRATAENNKQGKIVRK